MLLLTNSGFQRMLNGPARFKSGPKSLVSDTGVLGPLLQSHAKASVLYRNIQLRYGSLPASKNSFYRPSLADSVAKNVRPDPEFSGPIGEDHCFAVESNPMIRRLVAVLLKASFPLAIFWSVVAVIVEAFNRIISRRPKAHVFDEVFEGQPAVANCNATTTVTMECSVPRTRAAHLHGTPDFVFRNRGLAMCQHALVKAKLFYSRSFGAIKFLLDTSARLRFAVFEITERCDGFVSALANAFHKSVTKFVRTSLSQNCKAPINQSGNGFFFHFPTVAQCDCLRV